MYYHNHIHFLCTLIILIHLSLQTKKSVVEDVNLAAVVLITC